MKKTSFPYIALTLGTVLSILMLLGSEPMENGRTRLPLLMLLLASEFGFIVTLIGSGMGFNQIRKASLDNTLVAAAIGCLLLAAAFAYLGLQLWTTL